MLPAPSSSALDLELEPHIILRALASDARALARLYASYERLVLHTARRTLCRLRLPDPPRELASEVWLRLLDHGCRVLRAFDPARGSFRGFMKMVVWQHALAIARGWRRRTLREAAHLRREVAEPQTPCVTSILHHRLLARRILATMPDLDEVDLVLIEEALLWRTPARALAARFGYSTEALYKRGERLRTRLRVTARALEGEPMHAEPHGSLPALQLAA